MSGYISTFIVNGGRYDKIFWTESFNDGMQQVLDGIETRNKVDLAQIPRFNESEGHGPKRAHPVEDYFDDLSMHLVYEIYKRDFNLFKYDFENPGNKMPIGEIDLDEVHAKLGDSPALCGMCAAVGFAYLTTKEARRVYLSLTLKSDANPAIQGGIPMAVTEEVAACCRCTE